MQSPRGLVLGIGFALGLAGCATMPNAALPTWRPTRPSDDQVIATAVSSYLGSTLPPGRTTLMIQPVASGSSPLLDQLSVDLRASRASGSQQPNSGATGDSVRLVVSLHLRRLRGPPRLRQRKKPGHSLGAMSRAILQPSSPFVVREASQ